jgi:hypothetical protein
MKHQPAAVFSMGGYVAGPATIAAWLLRCPIVLMEPNAMPGMANRYAGKLASKGAAEFSRGSESRFFPSRQGGDDRAAGAERSFSRYEPQGAVGGVDGAGDGWQQRVAKRLNEAGKAELGAVSEGAGARALDSPIGVTGLR